MRGYSRSWLIPGSAGLIIDLVIRQKRHCRYTMLTSPVRLGTTYGGRVGIVTPGTGGIPGRRAARS
ncbi:MAG TPA: hypothetical protein DGB72_00935, partial [Gemmatimonadetes bacterium]|nr:hypothetical protein [Gemmatimonadota bacterium]